MHPTLNATLSLPTSSPDEGDVIWLDVNPDQRGREQDKRRPYVVLTMRAHNAKGLLTACPITGSTTRQPTRYDVPLRVLPPGGCSGTVLPHQIQTVDWKARNWEFICQVDPPCLQRVRQVIKVMLAIP